MCQRCPVRASPKSGRSVCGANPEAEVLRGAPATPGPPVLMCACAWDVQVTMCDQLTCYLSEVAAIDGYKVLSYACSLFCLMQAFLFFCTVSACHERVLTGTSSGGNALFRARKNEMQFWPVHEGSLLGGHRLLALVMPGVSCVLRAASLMKLAALRVMWTRSLVNPSVRTPKGIWQLYPIRAPDPS